MTCIKCHPRTCIRHLEQPTLPRSPEEVLRVSADDFLFPAITVAKSLARMPSTHSAVITYYAAYTALASAYLPIHPMIPDTPWTRIIVPSIVVPWAAAIAISRIWLGHHTIPQVLAGSVHGILFTYMWYSIWLRGANSYGQYLEQTYFARP